MTVQSNSFNPQELCSRKLWEIVSQRDTDAETTETLEAALEELAQRRHYLEQLRDLGISTPGTH